MERHEDARSKKVVFVASCLMNTNNKVKGLARYPGMCKEVFDTLYENDLGIQQMHCPETLYLGIQRWWQTKNLYDSHGFRSFCRKLAEDVVTYMEEYEREGYRTVAVLGCDGSPTCGVAITCWDKRWGGSPVDLDFNKAITEGSGVYMEELKKEIEARGFDIPPFYGLALDDESADMDRIITDFREFIKEISG
ncbi:MAG: 2-thiouracil desulfurase family protein [Eubacteriales bacterium]|nr:2-thiouracil desulfurase family protein [Eubacteriales bacterium]